MIVEDRIITLEELHREVSPRVEAIQRLATSESDFYARLNQLQNDILNEMINRILIVRDFEKDGRRKFPASIIDNYLAERIQNPPFDGDRSKFLVYLRDNGWTLRDYRKRLEEDLIYDVMRNQQRKSETVVSPMKVEAYYNDNKAKFYQEDSAHYRYIFLNRPAGTSDVELLAKAEPLLAKLKSGEKFEALARTIKEGPSRDDTSGDGGWQEKSKVKPEFAESIFKLAKGESSAPVITKDGCFIFYVEDRKYAGIPPLADVSAEIQRILVSQMARDAEDRWIARLRANAYIRQVESPTFSAPTS